MQPRPRIRRRRTHGAATAIIAATILLSSHSAHAIHHMKRAPIAYVARADDDRPLSISNQCPEVMYPGIGTQSGTGPRTNGFKLAPGEARNLSVSADWQGRVWGRTNCSFNDEGTGPSHAGGVNGGGASCVTGDCGGVVECKITVSSEREPVENQHLLLFGTASMGSIPFPGVHD